MEFICKIAQKWENNSKSRVNEIGKLVLKSADNLNNNNQSFSINNDVVWIKWSEEIKDLDVDVFYILPGFVDIKANFDVFLLKVGKNVKIPQHFDEGNKCDTFASIKWLTLCK